MKVECIKLVVDKIDYGINEDMAEYLSIGDVFWVYGLRFSEERTYFYIYNGEHIFEVPLELFKIIDNKVSGEWRMFLWSNEDITLWPELFYEEDFLENFAEREMKERKLFDILRKRMEQNS